MISAFIITDNIKPVSAGSGFMFIISIIEATGSITSIYMIRFDSGIYINITFGFSIGLGSGSSDIVAGGV